MNDIDKGGMSWGVKNHSITEDRIHRRRYYRECEGAKSFIEITSSYACGFGGTRRGSPD
jgi:hypothetical protein